MTRHRRWRALVVHRNDIVKRAVRDMLKDLQSIRLIAAVESVELAITKLSERPDILILDSDVSPLEAKSLVGGLARPTLIVLLRSADPAYLERAAQLPAKSFLPEEGLDRNKLVEVIQAALRGDLNIPAAMARHFLSRVAADGNSPALRLTSREEDVLRFLVQGLSNKEIARSLDRVEIDYKLRGNAAGIAAAGIGGVVYIIPTPAPAHHRQWMSLGKRSYFLGDSPSPPVDDGGYDTSEWVTQPTHPASQTSSALRVWHDYAQTKDGMATLTENMQRDKWYYFSLQLETKAEVEQTGVGGFGTSVSDASHRYTNYGSPYLAKPSRCSGCSDMHLKVTEFRMTRTDGGAMTC